MKRHNCKQGSSGGCEHHLALTVAAPAQRILMHSSTKGATQPAAQPAAELRRPRKQEFRELSAGLFDGKQACASQAAKGEVMRLAVFGQEAVARIPGAQGSLPWLQTTRRTEPCSRRRPHRRGGATSGPCSHAVLSLERWGLASVLAEGRPAWRRC